MLSKPGSCALGCGGAVGPLQPSSPLPPPLTPTGLVAAAAVPGFLSPSPWSSSAGFCERSVYQIQQG
ncbi:unnamed protein product [Dibothriocephalus latus]|uniref:Uncharacterized protein n=1 Tax=Dibothriocephalus latus TaxID=60516 RepID=A0A3P7R3P9_DIBLA|nr:unnamed protein product [Dibothriocephalus latus]